MLFDAALLGLLAAVLGLAGKLWFRAVFRVVDRLIGMLLLRTFLRGFDLLIGKLVLRAVLSGVGLLEGFITSWCSERFWGVLTC